MATLQDERSQHELLAFSAQLQEQYERHSTPEQRKARGQVFTPPAVARFMASLLSRFSESYHLLDPGAGVGTLTAAVCERFLSLRSPRRLRIDLYETDAALRHYLELNMQLCQQAVERVGHSMSYAIHEHDFLLSQTGDRERDLFGFNGQVAPVDAVITNPPYFKINKASEYARVMPEIVHGQPNIYALFLAQCARSLRRGGELVAITPRSFCNGLYFRQFRRWLLNRVTLKQVHLFESRTKAFQEAKVLQESIITHASCGRGRAENVIVTTSEGREFSDCAGQVLPLDQIVIDPDADMLLCLPATPEDAAILRYVQNWPSRFSDVRLRISTGPVVMFRTKPYLVYDLGRARAAPLLSAHNIRPFSTVWPVKKPKWPIAFRESPGSEKHLVPARNYVLLKRFSAKEEKRRLTAGCIFSNGVAAGRLALENHINYIYHADRDLTIEETYGVAALFNSTLIDRYFRTISGNTQVNATEIRTMRFPDLKLVARIGKRVSRLSERSRSKAEEIVFDELGINGGLRRYLCGRLGAEYA